MSILKKIFILISLLIYASSYLQEYKTIINGKELIYKSYKLIREDSQLDLAKIESTDFGYVNILVVDGAKLTINQGSIVEKSLSESDIRNLLQESENNLYEKDDYKYGLTSNIVAIGKNTKVIIKSSTISVNCPFSNAIMAFNDAVIEISNTTVFTKYKYSKGLVVFNRATVEIKDKSNFTTIGDFSPCLEINKDFGNIQGENVFLYSSGIESPLLNNKGNGKMLIFTGFGKAKNSQIMVVQGTNKVLLHDCEFTCYLNETSSYNEGGIVLFNTDFENDFTEINLDSCNLKIENKDNKTTPMFSCYDIEGTIQLTNTQTTFNNYFMIAYQIEGSNFATKINLDINKIGFKGIIETRGDAKIYLKSEQNLINEVELVGNINVQ